MSDVAGGPRKLAAELWRMASDVDVPRALKIKVMTLVTAVLSTNSKLMKNHETDCEHLSDEDLQRVARELLEDGDSEEEFDDEPVSCDAYQG